MNVGPQLLRGIASETTDQPFRTAFVRCNLLGLELVIAADIIGAVATDVKIDNLQVLGLIVMIRIVLSFAL